MYAKDFVLSSNTTAFEQTTSPASSCMTCRNLALYALFAMLLSCGGGHAPKDGFDDVVNGTVSGVVYKGLLAHGNVVIRAIGDGGWDIVVAEGTTDAAGSFDVEIGLGRGHLLVEVTGGTYTEEATGETVGLGSRSLTAWVPAFEVGEDRRSIQVNPVTTLMVAYTRWRMESLGEDFVLAERRASNRLNNHFGVVDWRTTLPLNPTTRRDLHYGDASIMGVLVAGLSWQAMELGETAGVTGRFVNTSALVELLEEDIGADGIFDGLGKNGRQLELHGVDLDGQTLRRDHAMAVLRFLQSDRNVSGLCREDLFQVLQDIVTNESEIFASPAVAPHFEPPSIVMDAPSPGAGVRGRVDITLRATDSTMVTDIGFMAPRQIDARDPTGRQTREARITGTLDVSSFDDGELTISVFAENDRGLRAVEHFNVYVANHVPLVVIESPHDSPENRRISGVVRVSASAEPSVTSGARIISMSAISPEGLVDTHPVASRFEAFWDTSTEREGPFTIQLMAEDEHGSIGRASIDVDIANKDAIIVSGVAMIAGRPVVGAVVSAQPLEGSDSVEASEPEPIGTALTDADGRFDLLLEDRNYAGPMSIIARGGSWTHPISDLTYSIPSNRFISTYLPTPGFLDAVSERDRPLVLGAWSTLAERLALHYSSRLINPLPPLLAWERSESMIGGHFHRNAHPCLHTTPTLDLTSTGAISFQHEAWLSFADFALASLMTDPGHSVFDLVAALANDISTGRFNGTGILGEAIGQVGRVNIDVETTRMTLAMAIYEFAAGDGNSSGIRETHLTQRSESREGNSFLDDLTVDSREIYGVPGTLFDTNGPMISWIHPSIDGEIFGAQSVLVHAVANATYGISAFHLIEPFVEGEPPVDELASIRNEVRYRFDSLVAPNASDYRVRVGLKAVDTVGNETTAYRTFSRTPPTAAISAVRALPGAVQITGPVSGRIRVEATGNAGFVTSSFSLLSPDPSLGAVGEDLDGSPTALRVEIDTTSVDPFGVREIPDGPMEIHVSHRAIDGRFAEDVRTVLVDNTPPELEVGATRTIDEHGVYWYGCEPVMSSGCSVAPVEVTFVVRDSTSGVDWVRLEGFGGPPGGAVGAISPEEIVLAGDCGTESCQGVLRTELPRGTYSLRVVAKDLAGNTIESSGLTVLVDTTSPILLDRSGVFDNEDEMDFLRDGDLFVYSPRASHEPLDISAARGSVPLWFKMEHRLFGSTFEEAISNNVPVISVAAADPGEPSTPTEHLLVEYLHSWTTDGHGWNGDDEWRLVPRASAGEDATHALPLSLEFLGEALLLGARHRVELRARDRAGNIGLAAYEMVMRLIPAPVAIEIDHLYPYANDRESVYKYTFADRNLHELFGGRTFENDGVRLARFVIHQPHEGLAVKLRAEIANDPRIRIARTQRRYIVETGVYEHPCVSVTYSHGICTYRALEAKPEEDNPPCVESWGDPDREELYKIYDDSGGYCLDRNDYPGPPPGMLAPTIYLAASQVLLLASDTSALQQQGPGYYVLERGMYYGYVNIDSPGSLGLFDSTTSRDGRLLYGVMEQQRRVFGGDMPWIRPSNCYAVDENPIEECIGHKTRGEDVRLYEDTLEVIPENGDTISLEILTGSVNAAISGERAPDRSLDLDIVVNHSVREDPFDEDI